MESLYDKLKQNNVNKKIDRLTANKLLNKRTKKSLNTSNEDFWCDYRFEECQ